MAGALPRGPASWWRWERVDDERVTCANVNSEKVLCNHYACNLFTESYI